MRKVIVGNLIKAGTNWLSKDTHQLIAEQFKEKENVEQLEKDSIHVKQQEMLDLCTTFVAKGKPELTQTVKNHEVVLKVL